MRDAPSIRRLGKQAMDAGARNSNTPESFSGNFCRSMPSMWYTAPWAARQDQTVEAVFSCAQSTSFVSEGQ